MSVKDSDVAKLLTRYENPTQTKKDVMNVFMEYRLNYALDSFVFNDGNKKELFNFHGTIPITYRNATYYIPIRIWLMDTHPKNAPLCFVEPTVDMQINVNMFVDHNGKVYLPYLHDWQPQESDIVSLIQVMTITFSENPPVFSKPKNPKPQYPYPGAGATPTAGGYGLPYPGADSRPQSTAGAYPLPMPSYNNMPPYPLMNNNSNPMANTPYPPASSSSGVYPPMPMPFNGGAAAAGPGLTQQGTITEEHIKASLISAIDDKIRRHVNERRNQYEAEINTLRRTKDELLEGRTKIREIISRLDNEEQDLQANLKILQGKDQQLSKQLENLNKIDRVDVDEAVTTTAPLYKQLLNAYAEEAAIEDVIYYLGEALRTNVIDLESFLKHVRQLSRKQFTLRALMQKCRQRAGLLG